MGAAVSPVPPIDGRRPGPYASSMHPQQPSRTARGVAIHRAVHQMVDGGRIFTDPLAVRILGADAEGAIREADHGPLCTRG